MLMPEKEVLLKRINTKRKEMLYVAEMRGLRSKETVKCSQELDNLLNTYQRFILNYKTLS
jgi:stage 0 sporulation regulatory protein